MTDITDAERRAVALKLCDFHRCPNTGLVIESIKHDDKALCGCGLPNPEVRGETCGTHLKAFLRRASVDDYMAQETERRVKLGLT